MPMRNQPEKNRRASAPSAQAASSLSPMQRADELLNQMSIEEKAMQLSSVFPLALFDTEGPNHGQLDAPRSTSSATR